MMREDLVAERVVIDSYYKEMVDYVGAQDPTFAGRDPGKRRGAC
jgi:hypothetical protein